MVKRGQATGATMLILVVLIIFVVLSAVSDPDGFRSAFSGNSSSFGVFKEYSVGVLSEGAGDLVIEIPSFSLDSLSNSRVLAMFPDVSPSNGFFRRNSVSKTFKIDSVLTDNVFLGFTASERRGSLVVLFNDNVVFSGVIGSSNVDPVRIPSNYLRDFNTLVFSTESGFLSGGAYTLRDVSVIGTVKDVSPLTRKVSFSLDGADFSGIVSAGIHFSPSCDGSVDLLVRVNNFVAGNGSFSCGVNASIFVPKSALRSGSNVLTFSGGSGVGIDNALFVPFSGISKIFSTTFRVDSVPRKLFLELDLPDFGGKVLRVNFNSGIFDVVSDSRFVVVDISNSTIVGTNYLEISPGGSVNVARARLRVG